MNLTKDKLLGKARHWEGISFNNQMDGKDSTPMITVEMTVEQWDKIWEEDAAPDMYEALKVGREQIANFINPKVKILPTKELLALMDNALSKAEGRKQ